MKPGTELSWKTEALGGEAAVSPNLIESGDWLGDPDWIGERLAEGAAAAGAAPFGLLALDGLGVAHYLGGSLRAEDVGPRLLETMESTLLWNTIEPRRHYDAGTLQSQIPTWAEELRLGARFYRAQGQGLGILLSAEEDHPFCQTGMLRKGARPLSAPTDEAADDLVEMILHHWRLRRQTSALWGFSSALTRAEDRAIIAIDLQGRVTYLSQAGGGLLGVTAGDAVGADCTRILRPAVEGEHPLLRGLSGEVGEIEFYVTNREGQDKPVSLRMSPILNRHGEVRGLIGLFRDMGEERALDQESRRRERLAVIGELAAGAAHEIRNPLTGIGNCAQVLQMRFEEDEKSRKMIDLILRETQRLERIITSMLRFARPGPPSLRETAVDHVVRELLQLEGPVCEQQGIRIDERITGTIPPIYIDPEQIRQVLQNLLRNARQAMPDGGLLSVEVSVVRRRLHLRRRLGRRATDRIHVPTDGPQARFVRVTIQDTGGGIPEDVLPRIFDPFFTTRSEGTGLGLSVSQSILQEHGAFIAVRSVEGKGTIFEVDLPVERRKGERRKDERGHDSHPGRG